MGSSSLLQYALFLLVVTVLVKPVGGYLAHVFGGEKTFLDPLLRPVERIVYKLARVVPEQEMDWKQLAMMVGRFGLAIPALALAGLSPRSDGVPRLSGRCRPIRFHLEYCWWARQSS